MWLKAFIFLLFMWGYFNTLGQCIVKGCLKDTTSEKNCSQAVVAILELDSGLVQYARSRKDGSFMLYGVNAGTYLLMVTHPSYSSSISSLFVSQPETDIGILILTPKENMLTPVIVTPRSSMPRLRGDTLEYNTAHIRTRANATVEELLGRLPGVEVDQDGNITVNGEKIDRLMVDGKDFFSDDPSIITRTFNADMIDKVQVLNKKSKHAEFTGVDDGKRTKTLNLTLKEDSKKGVILKVEAAGDTHKYYSVNELIGAFNGNRQFVALGMAANTGTMGFSGSGGNINSKFNLSGGVTDAMGASAGSGIPRVIGAGTHYAGQWCGNKNSIVGNYKYGSMSTQPASAVMIQQTLPDSIYTQQELNSSRNFNIQHSLDAVYKFIPDTVFTFNFLMGGNVALGHNTLTSLEKSSFNDTLANSSLRNLLSDVNDRGFRTSIMVSRKEKRNIGRVLSFSIGIARQDNFTNGYLYSLNEYYKTGGSLIKSDTTDQHKAISLLDQSVSGSISYTRPVLKSAVLELSYSLSNNVNRSLHYTYGKGDGKYELYIDSLSSHFRNNVLTQQLTLNIQSGDNFLRYLIGGDLLDYTYKQSDLIKQFLLKYHFMTFAPRVSIRINVSERRGFNIDYNGSTLQPDINQLQPIQNNNDPLRITLGNPNLHSSFTHHLGLEYSSITTNSFMASFILDLATDAISTRTSTDSLGRQVSQAVNVQGTRFAEIRCSFNRQIIPLELNLNLYSSLSYDRSVNYVNTYLSKNNNYLTRWGARFTKFVPDRYSFTINSGLTYTYSSSSINSAHPTRYWTQNHVVQLSLFLLQGFEIFNSIVFNWRQKIDNFDKRNAFLLWNAYVGKSFLKNQLSIRWQINDILGQNTGVTRNSGANLTSERVSNVLSRYWMLTASWRFIRHTKMN